MLLTCDAPDAFRINILIIIDDEPVLVVKAISETWTIKMCDFMAERSLKLLTFYHGIFDPLHDAWVLGLEVLFHGLEIHHFYSCLSLICYGMHRVGGKAREGASYTRI